LIGQNCDGAKAKGKNNKRWLIMRAVYIVVVLILSALILSSCEQINQSTQSNQQGTMSIKDVSLHPEKYENQTITLIGKATSIDAGKCWAANIGLRDSEGYYAFFRTEKRIFTLGQTYTITGRMENRISQFGTPCYVIITD
jgi:hypothetical protein